ncbi:hypothetical protein OS493_038074, partial [Desmophyllum pertusum]
SRGRTKKTIQISEYELQRNKRIEESQLEQIKNNLIPRTMAIIAAALFYLKAKTLSELSMIVFKDLFIHVLPARFTGSQKLDQLAIWYDIDIKLVTKGNKCE